MEKLWGKLPITSPFFTSYYKHSNGFQQKENLRKTVVAPMSCIQESSRWLLLLKRLWYVDRVLVSSGWWPLHSIWIAEKHLSQLKVLIHDMELPVMIKMTSQEHTFLTFTSLLACISMCFLWGSTSALNSSPVKKRGWGAARGEVFWRTCTK